LLRQGATVQETKWDAERKKSCINIYAHASASQICLQNLCGQQQNSPMADPTLGPIWIPKWGPSTKRKRHELTFMFKLQGRKICLHNMCGQQRNSPMADLIFGSKYGPQNGAQNWITFSFLLLCLCVPSPVATVQETKWDAEREKACINTYAHASASQICLQNLCGQQQNSPMADPTLGPIWILKQAQAKT